MKAEADQTNSDNEDDAEDDDYTGFVSGPVAAAALDDAVDGGAKLEGRDSGHFED